MKTQLLTVVLLLLCASAFAQGKGVKLSIGPEVGLPLGDDHNAYSVIFGGTAKLEFPISKSDFNITYTIGYMNYFGKNVNTSYTSNGRTVNLNYKYRDMGYLPIKFGGKYYANKYLYVEGEAGISFFLNLISSSGHATFVYAPGIGTSLPFSKKKNALDLGVRFEGHSANGGSQLALRMAYKFGL